MTRDKGPRWQVPGRDEYVNKQTPRTGVPAFVEEECTGKYEGEELARIRARRPTPERISKLEVKHDALALTVARMDGKVDTLVDYAAKAEQERDRRRAAEQVAADKAQAAAIAAEENRRKFIIRLIGALATAAAVVIAALVAR